LALLFIAWLWQVTLNRKEIMTPLEWEAFSMIVVSWAFILALWPF